MWDVCIFETKLRAPKLVATVQYIIIGLMCRVTDYSSKMQGECM